MGARCPCGGGHWGGGGAAAARRRCLCVALATPAAATGLVGRAGGVRGRAGRGSVLLVPPPPSRPVERLRGGGDLGGHRLCGSGAA